MAGPGEDRDGESPEHGVPTVRDKRRIDPETGQVRDAEQLAAAEPLGGAGQFAGTEQPVGAGRAGGTGRASSVNGGAAGATASAAAAAYGAQPSSALDADRRAEQAEHSATEAGAEETALELAAATARVQELVSDLQRLQAEYVNYRKRVERDRDLVRELAIAGVLEALMPVLDDVHLARRHGDLESGPFAAIAEKLETTLNRYGLERYGEPGETFDPTIHEALIHTEAELAEGTTDTTVVQVLQPGYRVKDRVLRAARVAVADPE